MNRSSRGAKSKRAKAPADGDVFDLNSPSARTRTLRNSLEFRSGFAYNVGPPLPDWWTGFVTKRLPPAGADPTAEPLNGVLHAADCAAIRDAHYVRWYCEELATMSRFLSDRYGPEGSAWTRCRRCRPGDLDFAARRLARREKRYSEMPDF